MTVRKLTVGGCLTTGAIALLALLALLFLYAWALMWGYNASFAPWLGWPPLTFREAFGLSFLGSVVFGVVAAYKNFPGYHRSTDH